MVKITDCYMYTVHDNTRSHAFKKQSYSETKKVSKHKTRAEILCIMWRGCSFLFGGH